MDISDLSTLKFTVTVLELIGFSELAAGLKTMTQQVSELIALTDSNEAAYLLSITEALSLVDTNSVLSVFFGTISESIDFAETITPIKTAYPSLTDSIVFTETTTNLGVFGTSVYDTLKLNVIIDLAGEIYECYALNTPKFHPSMYSGFNFNSYCLFENRAFGANDDGIFELTGTTDNGSAINTGVVFHPSNLGVPLIKKWRRGYFTISGTQPLMILETEEGQRQVYRIDAQGRAVASSELRSKKWTLSVANFDTLDGLTLVPVLLTR